jgi:hypothetical protein
VSEFFKKCAKPQEVAETVSVAASENDEGLKELDACFDSLAPSSQEVYELATTISQAEAFLRANEHYNAPASSDGGESQMKEEAMGTLAGQASPRSQPPATPTSWYADPKKLVEVCETGSAMKAL